MKNLTQARFLIALTILLGFDLSVSACPVCRAQVKATIYNDSFWFNLIVLSLPLLLLAMLSGALFYGHELRTKLEQKLK